MWVGLVSLAVLALVPVVYHSAALSHAQVPEPPPGDCWNGALTEDPLHCYIFEEAQRAGEIDIAAVYVAPGDGRSTYS